MTYLHQPYVQTDGHDASWGHWHLCPVCGKQSPTTSRVCPEHTVIYLRNGEVITDKLNKESENGKQ